MAESSNPNEGLKNKEGPSSNTRKSLKLKRLRTDTAKSVLPDQKKTVKNHDDSRFSFDVTIEELDAFKEGDCPTNTLKNTEWALKTFESWRTTRNKNHELDLCPQDLFEMKGHQEICWLCKFVTETRKGDGKEYTPRSLYLLLSALQRHVRKTRPSENFNFFQDPMYCPLKNVCNAIFKRLHSEQRQK